MDCTYMDMLDLAIEVCKDADVAKGIKIAKAIVEDSGYVSYDDWLSKTDKEQIEEIRDYLGYVKEDEL